MKTLIRTFLWRAWLPLVLLVTWWVASADSESLYFPPLQTITEVFVRDWLGEHFSSDLIPSILKLLAGFAISATLGISLGVLLGINRYARGLTAPLILFFRSLPGPVLVPIGIMLIGIGAEMNIFIMVLGAIWPTLMNTIDGVRSLDPVQRDMTSSYRLSLWQRIFEVILPNASPQIFAGLRTTLQLSIILIVVSEMVASLNGVGFYILYSQQTFEVPETWAGTFVLGVLGYLASLIFVAVERRVLSWQVGTIKE